MGAGLTRFCAPYPGSVSAVQALEGVRPRAPRTLHHAAYPAARIAAERELSVSLCLPAKDEAATIGPILESLMPLVERGAVDQVVVLDDSTDGTGDIAGRIGAEVHIQSDLMADFGPVRGKGDAMWRALAVATGDVVCFLDADSERFGEHFACGLVGPITCEPHVAFVKGYYERPFRLGTGAEMPEGGGRVTELMARPLLNLFYPQLSGFLQPLAGEIAARRELLLSVPFMTGYGVDVALLIDVWRRQGAERLAQVDLEVRQNQHKRLSDLVPMAEAVLGAVLRRAQEEGRLTLAEHEELSLPFAHGESLVNVRTEERPPFEALGAGI